MKQGLPWWLSGNESACNAGDQVWSLGWEDPLEKEMATHSSILAWRIPWTEEPDQLQSRPFQRVIHDWITEYDVKGRQNLMLVQVIRTDFGQLPSGNTSGFSNTWTVNSQMFKLVLEKAEETEIKLPTSTGSWKKQESSRKISLSALLTMPKPLTVWITINCGKFWKRWEYQTT